MSIKNGAASKLPDFNVLKTQLAKATPTGVSSAAYVVSNTAAQACPTTGSDWSASSKLPPIANSDVCTCMVKSMGCIAKTGLTGNQTADLFDTVCGLDKTACAGITADAENGVYGAYSMCDAYSKLSFAFGQYYKNQKSASDACNFGGNAKIQTASQNGNCKALVSQAGAGGTGTVTAIPTGTGTSSSGATTSTSKAAASGLTIPRFDAGALRVGAYVVVAGLAGAAMVLL